MTANVIHGAIAWKGAKPPTAPVATPRVSTVRPDRATADHSYFAIDSAGQGSWTAQAWRSQDAQLTVAAIQWQDGSHLALLGRGPAPRHFLAGFQATGDKQGIHAIFPASRSFGFDEGIEIALSPRTNQITRLFHQGHSAHASMAHVLELAPRRQSAMRSLATAETLLAARFAQSEATLWQATPDLGNSTLFNPLHAGAAEQLVRQGIIFAKHNIATPTLNEKTIAMTMMRAHIDHSTSHRSARDQAFAQVETMRDAGLHDWAADNLVRAGVHAVFMERARLASPNYASAHALFDEAMRGYADAGQRGHAQAVTQSLRGLLMG